MIKFLRFLFILSMVTAPAGLVVYVAKQGAIWAFHQFSYEPGVDMDIYTMLMLWFYAFFAAFLMIPKFFIYRRSLEEQPRKFRYDFAIYFGLPLVALLFLPGEQLVTYAFWLIMTAAAIEAIYLYLPPLPQPKTR